jgi:hypothetical protein
MVNHRILPFERVVKNLKEGKYKGKISSADYSNLGLQIFEERKFAEQLGVSADFLRMIGLVRITNQAGWNLPRMPTVDELTSYRDKIERENFRIDNNFKTLKALGCR